MQEFIPSRNLTTRPCDPKCWTLACTRPVEAKDKAWKCWLRNKWDPGLKQNFLVAVNLTVKVIAKAKSAMEARIRSKLATGSLRDKEWWCTMKRASGSNKESSVPLLIDSSGKEYHSSQEKSECLAQYFSHKCSLGNDELNNLDLPIPTTPDFPPIANIHFRKQKVKQHLKKDRPNKNHWPRWYSG